MGRVLSCNCLTSEPLEVGKLAQGPLDAGRRHLEGVGAGQLRHVVQLLV